MKAYTPPTEYETTEWLMQRQSAIWRIRYDNGMITMSELIDALLIIQQNNKEK